MSEKRFEYTHVDGFKPYIYDVDDNHMIDDLKIICEILNLLNDENVKLKSDIQLHIEDNEKYRKLSIQLDNSNNELTSENTLLEDRKSVV